ncbi:MAG: DUF2142 domain-containing protein [Acidobacteria bacterium]|nr:DUF2142 domain-containing protein [Acidobacteriota bacterium]
MGHLDDRAPILGPGDGPFFSKNFVRLFFAVYLVLGLVLIALTPPFQSPDAFGHFDRAVGLSQGKIDNTIVRGVPGEPFTVGLFEMETVFSQMSEAPTTTATKFEYTYSWQRTWNMPLYFTNFVYGGNYPFLYVPQTFGVIVGRIISNHLLVGYYLAVIFNLLAFVGLTKWAFARLPQRIALSIGIFLLLPMVNSLAISVNPDCLLLALSVVFAAALYCNYCESRDRETPHPFALGRTSQSRQRFARTSPYYQIGFASLLFMAVEKPPLLLLGLLLPLADLHSNLRRYVRRTLVFMFSTGAVYELWVTFGAGPKGKSVALAGVAPMRQLKLVLTNPHLDVTVLVQSGRTYGLLYWKEFVAGIGWLDTWFPSWFYILTTIVLALAFSNSVLAGSRDTFRTLWSLFAIALVAGALVVAFYLVDTSYASTLITGLQGRYFLPLVPVLLVVLSPEPTRSMRFRPIGAVVEEYASFALIGLQLWIFTSFALTLLRRYWGW